MLLSDCENFSIDRGTSLLKLTKTQVELAEKFTTAFYEAQNLNKSSELFNGHEDILDSFNENYFDNVDAYDNTDCDYFLDFLISKGEEEQSLSQTSTETEQSKPFNSDEFLENFDQINNSSFGEKREFIDLSDLINQVSSSSESTTKSQENYCSFYIPPPFSINNRNKENTADLYENLNEIDLSDLEFHPNASNSSVNIDDPKIEIYDVENSLNLEIKEWKRLPPVTSLIRNDVDFSTFLRHLPAESLSVFDQQEHKNPVGHLVRIQTINNNLNECTYETNTENQVILHQDEALLKDDPLLSSNTMLINRNLIPKLESPEFDLNPDGEELFSTTHMQCKWEECYHICASQSSLVQHIEKNHVEPKRGEEFTCFWFNCPRKTKPFNARYKLLIHMRVHSGEKPNKCLFKGCNKAFSRLENLKIHQRSHTGERPYLCQFANCTKSFSNSSDRAKHQRTHFDTKPYACQVAGCIKKYTDPSSLRKHVKNHTVDEQLQLKKKSAEGFNDSLTISANNQRKLINAAKSKKYLYKPQLNSIQINQFYNEHSYTNTFIPTLKYEHHIPYSKSTNIKLDLKNKISGKAKKTNSLFEI